VRGGQDHFLAHPAVGVNTEHLELGAAVGLALAAGDAGAAMEVGIDGTKIAGGDMLDPSSGGEHLDAQLMAKDAWIGKKWLPSLIRMKVCTADANGANADQGFAWAGGVRGGELGP